MSQGEFALRRQERMTILICQVDIKGQPGEGSGKVDQVEVAAAARASMSHGASQWGGIRIGSNKEDSGGQ